jgi:hypothetical protein
MQVIQFADLQFQLILHNRIGHISLGAIKLGGNINIVNAYI